MNLAPPPPTQFRELSGPVAERINNLWRLATDDDQRWEIERLAVEIMAMPEPESRDGATVAIFSAGEWAQMEDSLADDVAEAVRLALSYWKGKAK